MSQIPPSLAPYTVEQDYAQYDAADQATWRFVLMHLAEHLERHAHPSYMEGLAAAGMRLDRIPTIAEMNAALEKFGWSAVCVTGFVPPRAFQAFQAASILPIAAEIRSPEHLAYTPAPDIVHEAAGHAPLLLDPEYASYLREVGELGRFAFSSVEDQDVYLAILNLSKVKELPGVTAAQEAAAVVSLTQALAAQDSSTEATRLSRLYWWTAEYGLVGSLDDYRLYGAGLLSSLGESHYCRRPEVEKRPLDVACMDVSYDITKPQPQLFVTPDFAALQRVLNDARGELAALGPIDGAVRAAAASRLPCKAQFGPQCELEGVLVSAPLPGTVAFSGPAIWDLPASGVSVHGEPLPRRFDDLVLRQSGELFVRRNAGLEPASSVDWQKLRARSEVALETAEGQTLTGGFAAALLDDNQHPIAVYLKDAVFSSGGGIVHFDHYLCPLVPLQRVLPGDDTVGTTSKQGSKAPAPRDFSDAQLRLRSLYADASSAWNTRTASTPIPVFGKVLEHLKEFPTDWLLRWNVLESLLKLGKCDDTHSLFQELEELELEHERKQPIATGLRSLRRLSGA